MYLLSNALKSDSRPSFHSLDSKEQRKPPRSSGTDSYLQAEQDIKLLVNSILKKNMTRGEEIRELAPPRKFCSWGTVLVVQHSSFYMIKNSPLLFRKAPSACSVLSRAGEHDQHHARHGL